MGTVTSNSSSLIKNDRSNVGMVSDQEAVVGTGIGPDVKIELKHDNVRLNRAIRGSSGAARTRMT